MELRKTVSISFLDHVLYPHEPAYHLRFQLLEQTRHFPLTEDLEFHVLELPKFTKTAEELTSGLDIWLYLLRHAATMDLENLPAAIRQYPLAVRALEELRMLAQTDAERERYEARRKAQLDDNTRMKVARLEGRDKGEKIGVIQLCEEMLQRPQTPKEELDTMSLDTLTRLAEELKAQLSKPNR
jgi:predicted transposase/invertase (TIGR01784 family)